MVLMLDRDSNSAVFSDIEIFSIRLYDCNGCNHWNNAYNFHPQTSEDDAQISCFYYCCIFHSYDSQTACNQRAQPARGSHLATDNYDCPDNHHLQKRVPEEKQILPAGSHLTGDIHHHYLLCGFYF